MGGALVALVVMSYVFLGGMRGTAWVNAFQTSLFLCFGAVAFFMISRNLGGFDEVIAKLAAEPKTAPLLTRERIPVEEFFSYTFIPLSSIMFPHMAIMCFTAERVTPFKKTVVFYPICIPLLWLPCVFLGVVAASQFPGLSPGRVRRRPPAAADREHARLARRHSRRGDHGVRHGRRTARFWRCAPCSPRTSSRTTAAGSDSAKQTEVWTGRAFVVVVTLVAYLIALELKDKAGIFELAIRFAFSGFAALAPVMVAALFWKRSTKWGALAAALWVAATMVGYWYLYSATGIAPKPGQPFVQIFPALGDLFLRSSTNVLVHGYLPVLPMCLGSALWMIVVSLLTPPPNRATIARYFPA